MRLRRRIWRSRRGVFLYSTLEDNIS
jgi:hypothetical protein